MSARFPALSRSVQSTVESLLLIDDWRDGIYEVDDAMLQFNRSISNYYSIEELSLIPFSHVKEPDGSILPVSLTANYYDERFNTYQKSYNLTDKDPFGPFSGSNTTEFKSTLSKMESFTQTFWLISPEILATRSLIHIRWEIQIIYNVILGALLPDVIITKITQSDTVFEQEGWVSVILLIFTVISSLLSLKRIFMGYTVYKRCRDKFATIPQNDLVDYFDRNKIQPVCLSWEEIPFDIKFEFFSSWHMFSFFGDLTIGLGAWLRLASDFGSPTREWSRLLSGIGCLILCTNMTKYLEYNLSFYTLILTLRSAFYKIIRYFISVFPIFMGFVLCGVIVFAPYSTKFATVDTATSSLFALINGDEISGTFEHLLDVYPFTVFGRIYLYFFILLFMTAILNVCIFIIEESFHLGKVLADQGRESTGDLDPDALTMWDHLQHSMTLTRLFEILEINDSTKPLLDINTNPPPSSAHPKSNNSSPNSSTPLLVPVTPISINVHPQTPGGLGLGLGSLQNSFIGTPSSPSLSSSTPAKKRITVKKMVNIIEKHKSKFMAESTRTFQLQQAQLFDNIWKDLKEMNDI
eukprot:TRINITY_DN1320_c0_g1_i2.p1 TRINITY_DN1320_c0_g1~~TRINITY_DN1320_c0_g1_i2.p1  ORF type:complete len:580 (+),score=114.71 TRINITY_DN1320_c0_g1_i2:342-2081(+)